MGVTLASGEHHRVICIKISFASVRSKNYIRSHMFCSSTVVEHGTALLFMARFLTHG